MAATLPAAALLLALLLGLMWTLGRLLGRLAERARLPSVVGEIAAGIVLGPSALALLDPASPAYGAALDAVAALGIIILLFCVGLETRLADLKRIGRVATLTATAGVITPLTAGTALLLALAFDWRAAVFVGAAMVATSVGITARVLADMKMAQSVPAQIIHGAAVIDDVMGMVVLAVVSAVAAGKGASAFDLVLLVGAGLLFVLVSLFWGPGVVRLFAPYARRPLSAPGSPSRKALVVAFTSCLALAAVSGSVGLAPIIGAFLAGVAFAEVEARFGLRRQLEPARRALAPFFFIQMGARVSVGTVLASPPLFALALALTALAAVTKYLPCRLAARSQGKVRARVVGAGMIPRGEVGLIVASTALAAGIVTPALFSVVVFMSVGTSLVGPPLLRATLPPRGLGGPQRSLKEARALESPSSGPAPR